MEEKERYKYFDGSKNIDKCIFIDGQSDDYIDNLGEACNLLNQQDKRIKELEEELDDAKRDYIPKLEFGLQRANKIGRDAEKEIQQLKQQLHDLPKKIVEEVEKNFTEYLPLKYKTGAGFYARLNAILKKFGGENESVCD